MRFSCSLDGQKSEGKHALLHLMSLTHCNKQKLVFFCIITVYICPYPACHPPPTSWDWENTICLLSLFSGSEARQAQRVVMPDLIITWCTALQYNSCSCSTSVTWTEQWEPQSLYTWSLSSIYFMHHVVSLQHLCQIHATSLHDVAVENFQDCSRRTWMERCTVLCM